MDRLTLQEAQKLIDKAKERLVLFVIPNKLNTEKLSAYRKISSPLFFSSTRFVLATDNEIHNHQEPTSIPIIVQNRPSSSRKELQADYNQHIFERPNMHRHDLIRSR